MSSKMRKRIILAAALMAVALAAAALILFPRGEVRFDGDSISNPDRFALRFERMNTVDSETMSFQEGDSLHVSWQIESGRVDLAVGMEGEAPVYQANGRSDGDKADFDVIIPKAGMYTVSISAVEAKGWIELVKAKHE